MKYIHIFIILCLLTAAMPLAGQEVPVFLKTETAQSKIDKPDKEKLASEYFRNKDYEKARVLYEERLNSRERLNLCNKNTDYKKI